MFHIGDIVRISNDVSASESSYRYRSASVMLKELTSSRTAYTVITNRGEEFGVFIKRISIEFDIERINSFNGIGIRQ